MKLVRTGFGGSRLYLIAQALEVAPGYFYAGLPGTAKEEPPLYHQVVKLAQQLQAIERPKVKEAFKTLIAEFSFTRSEESG